MLQRLTPSRERGAVLAAGAVVMTTFAALIDARFSDSWDAGPRLLVIGTTAMLIGTLALLAPLDESTPRSWQSVLYVADFVLTALALGELADALGAEAPLSLTASGTIVWVGLVLICLCVFYATQRRSPIMTLLGAATAVVVVNEFFRWVADPRIQTHRWLLLVCAIVSALGAVALRDLHRRHAVSLVDVAGVSVAAIGATLVLQVVIGHNTGPNVAAGWELVLLVTGFGLLAYGAVDRERVPEFIGVLVIGLFVVLAGYGQTSLLWWPILLLLAGGALLAVGLRPRRSLPPEPPVPPTAPAPPTEPTAVAGP